MVPEIERDYEQRRLLVSITNQNLVHKGEDAVKSEFQREILGEKDVEHIVYPFNSTDKLLVVCICKEGILFYLDNLCCKYRKPF